MAHYDFGEQSGEMRKHSNGHAVAGDEAVPTSFKQFVSTRSLEGYNRFQVFIRRPTSWVTSYKVSFYRWIPGDATPNILLIQTSGVLNGSPDLIEFDHKRMPWTVRIHDIITSMATDGTPFDVRYAGLNLEV